MGRVLPPTRRGYSPHECISAFQKAVRRSQPHQALYWASELDKSGYSNWLWKRIRVIVSEDIGLAEPDLPQRIHALDQWYQAGKAEGLELYHAVLLVAFAKKSRLVAVGAILHGTDHIERLEIPDEALDKHTLRGKQMGRGIDHFIKEAAKVVDPETSTGMSNTDAIEHLEAAYVEARWCVINGEAPLPENPWEERESSTARGEARLDQLRQEQLKT